MMTLMGKETLSKLSYGMYFVGSCIDGKPSGLIANVVFQVTSKPPKIATSVNKDNQTYQAIKKSGHFSVSILDKNAPMDFIVLFGYKSGNDVEKFEKVAYMNGENGCPIIKEHSVGFIETKVVDEVDMGSHVLFIGEVTKTESSSKEEPMTYKYYQTEKKGRSPKSAPTYRGGG